MNATSLSPLAEHAGGGLHHLIGGADDLGVHLIGALRGDQVGDFRNHLDVGRFKIALLHVAEAVGIGEAVLRRSGSRRVGEKVVADRLQARLAGTLEAVEGGRRLLALLTGDRQALDQADWDRLQATGTTHLLVISGLHVGMLAAAVFALTALVLRYLPLRWSRPQLWLSAPVALLAAAGYAGLAGSSFEI